MLFLLVLSLLHYPVFQNVYVKGKNNRKKIYSEMNAVFEHSKQNTFYLTLLQCSNLPRETKSVITVRFKIVSADNECR